MFSARDLQRQEGLSAQPWGGQKISVPHHPQAQEMAPLTPPLRLGRLGRGKALSASTKAALRVTGIRDASWTPPSGEPWLWDGRAVRSARASARPPLLCKERLASRPGRDSLTDPQPREAIWGQNWSPLKVKGW